MVDDARLHQVLIDIRSNFNSLHQDLHKNGSFERPLRPSLAPLYIIISSKSTTLLGHSTKLFPIEFMNFEVVDIDTSHHVIIQTPRFTKFTVIPHYTYPILKMLGHKGVITAKGDLRQSCTCDTEGNNLTKSQLIQAESNDLKEAFKQSHLEA